MKLALALFTFAALALPASAQAKPLHRCAPDGETTLATRGVQCHYAQDTIDRLFRTTRAERTPLSVTRHFRTTGAVGYSIESTHTFDCAVRYVALTGVDRGDVRLTVRCHDFGGAIYPGIALIRFTEHFES